MKKVLSVLVLAVVLSVTMITQAFAHFGMVIPDTNVVEGKPTMVGLQLSFSHPFEMVGMNLDKPLSFKVYQDGKAEDLTNTLEKQSVMDHAAWKCDYKIKRPGVYAFVLEPVPYDEPAEGIKIQHYTKTYVSGFGEGEGWNSPLGLKTEIIPLTRPWGNYAGNVFQGIVLLDGKPVPFGRVEVEFYNSKGSVKAPNETMITQEVLCDSNGVFTFTCPLSGWWGFAGLNEQDGVEYGAVLWIKMDSYN